VTRRTQAERSATTRAALLAAARELFAANGFAATGREQIAESAGVTRGALYHHFGSKEQLFRVVVEELEIELGGKVMMAAATSPDAAEQLRLGCMAFLDACLDPAVRRVVLIEAPVVLGWDQWREIDAQHGLLLVTHALQAVVESGQMSPVAVEPLAHLLLGALNEAAMLVANAKKPKVARAEVGATLDLLLDRIITPA
jgi:AcrR family transcriptional regulator